MITLVDVCKSFNGHPVLCKTSLEVRKNEVVGLLGRSGSGKSTILNIVADLVCPDSGSVKVDSKKIGYIFQGHRLIPWKTALENVCFSLKAGGCNPETSREIAAGYIQKMGLVGFENHYPAQLSGGMCQRVSIARAFAINPDILLMDEPFSALDLELKETLLAIVREMLTHHHSMTVLYVSHDPEEVSRLAKRFLLLIDGGVIQEFSPGPDRSFKKMIRKRFRNRNVENRVTG